MEIKMLKKFADKIVQLNAFEKENILNEEFILEDEGKIKIFYAPHNEFINTKAQNYFINEIKELENTVIIPLGKAVEEVLMYLVNNRLIENKYLILYGFPHPSGANGHRKEIFANNKEALIKIVNSIN